MSAPSEIRRLVVMCRRPDRSHGGAALRQSTDDVAVFEEPPLGRFLTDLKQAGCLTVIDAHNLKSSLSGDTRLKILGPAGSKVRTIVGTARRIASRKLYRRLRLDQADAVRLEPVRGTGENTSTTQ